MPSSPGRGVGGWSHANADGQDLGVDDMARLERIVARLPEAQRVDIAAWGGEPTSGSAGKNLVFTDHTRAGSA